MPSSYAVGEHFEQLIKQQVEGGRYASASEVVRDGLRLLEEEQQRRGGHAGGTPHRRKKGLASGKGKPAEEVLGRLERKYADFVMSRHTK